MANHTLYMNRYFKWDSDVLEITDKVHDALHEAEKKIEDATFGEVVNHFNCDLSDFREYLRDREAWQRRQAEKMPRWVPVADEPPEAGVIVWDGVNPPHEARMIGEIIIEDDGEQKTKVYVDGEELTEYLTGDADEMPPRITHWTMMPDPPETDAPAKNGAETPT